MVISLLQDEEQMSALQDKIKKLGLPLAAQSIVSEIIKDLGA
jgi:hypothetical protein